MARGAALGLVLSAGWLSLAVLLEGCDGDGEPTGGKRVVLHTRVEVDSAAKTAFSTAFGWNVTLEGALLSTGPLYYFDGPPALVSFDTPRRSEYAMRWLGLGTAHAHPGHYQEGNALGQMLDGASIDLWAGPATLADGEGITGTYRSARFSFRVPGEGPLSEAFGGNVAVAFGTAQKDGEETRTFRAVAALSDVEKSASEGQVEGCELNEVAVEDDGTIKVVIKPQVWLDLVDFAQIEVGSTDEPAELPNDAQPGIAFAQGLAQLSAYEFSYEAD